MNLSATLCTSPTLTPRRRLDETRAAGQPKLRWDKPEPFVEAAEQPDLTAVIQRWAMCLCRAVSYRCSGEAGPTGYCHCTDCGRAIGDAQKYRVGTFGFG